MLVIGSATDEVNLLEKTIIEPALTNFPDITTTTSEPIVNCITSTPPTTTEINIEELDKSENEVETTEAAPKSYISMTEDRVTELARDAFRFAKVAGEKSSKAAADTFNAIRNQLRKM